MKYIFSKQKLQLITYRMFIMLSLVVFMSTQNVAALTEGDVYSFQNNTTYYEPGCESGLPDQATKVTGTGTIPPGKIYIMGDSITLSAKSAYESKFSGDWKPTVEGLDSRQISGGVNKSGIEQIEADTLPIASANAIVIALGTNGIKNPKGTTTKQVEDAMKAIKKANTKGSPIFWVNVISGKAGFDDYSKLTNEAIEAGVGGQGVIIDWYSEAKAKADYKSFGDGVHPKGKDINLLAKLVYDTVSATSATDVDAAVAGAPEDTTECCDNGDGSSTEINTTNFGSSDNLKNIFEFFVANGYTKEQAAGIVGNVYGESSGSPERYQGDGKDHAVPPSSSPGWGIVQWTPNSKITNYAKSVDKKANLLSTQLEFLLKQLEGKVTENNEKAAGDLLKAAKTVAEATKAFQNGYERPADRTGSLAKRTGRAEAALKLYGPGATETASSPGGAETASACQCDVNDANAVTGSLDQLLLDLASKNGGQTKIAASSVDGKQAGSADGGDQVPTRSSYKIYTAYATLRAIEAGKISWSTDIWDGKSVNAAMTKMIINSDNDAAEALRTNSTIGTPAVVTKLLQSSVGLSDKTVMGTGSASDPKGSNSQSTADDYVKFLLLLQKHKLPGVSKEENYTKLINLMKKATTDGGSGREGIAEGVPGSTEVADKPGWAGGGTDPASNDVGIVYLKDKPYVVAILTDKPNKWTGVASIAKEINTAMAGGKTATTPKAGAAAEVDSGTSTGTALKADCGGSGGNGDLVGTVKSYAHPEYHAAPFLKRTPAYAAAVAAAIKKGQYVGGSVGGVAGIDCGGFVTRVMLDSGYEPKYNSSGKGGNTLSQEPWMAKNWKKINPKSTSDMEPGDVAINANHTYLYVGKIGGFNSVTASASYSTSGNGRAPMAGHEAAADPDFNWYRKK